MNEDEYVIPKIESFKDLMDEISYSWDHNNREFSDCGNGIYCLNKLYIHPTRVDYKTWSYELKPEVYQKFLKFLEFLKD